MSLIPSIPVSSFLIFSERTAILSRFCPYTFTPTSVLIPVESILIRLEIGMVQPLVTPGICSLAFSSLMRSSFVLPSRHSLCGFNKIMVSIMEMGELSVAVLALPAFPRTCSTSGIPLMILSCTCSNLLASEFEISGRVTGIKSRDPSSKGGINSRPRFIIIGILMSSAKILIPSVVFFHFMHHLISGS